LREELNSDVTGLYNIRRDKEDLDEKSQQSDNEEDLKAVEVELQRMKP